jgi:hypothetical protein
MGSVRGASFFSSKLRDRVVYRDAEQSRPVFLFCPRDPATLKVWFTLDLTRPARWWRCSRRSTRKKIDWPEKKAMDVVAKLHETTLEGRPTIVKETVAETLAISYMVFPREHWTRSAYNNPLELIMQRIRHRPRVVRLPRWHERVDARGGSAALRGRHTLGLAEVPRHDPARGTAVQKMNDNPHNKMESLLYPNR